MPAEKLDRFRTLRNNSQQQATTCNRVCKRTQRVTSNNVGSCWPKINVVFVCTGFQVDSANSLNRWTFWKASAYRLRVGGRTLDEYSPYSTKPPFAYEYLTHRLGTKMNTMASWHHFGFHLRRGHFVSRPCYFTIIAILLGYPAEASMEERGILVRSLFFQKNTISPRRSYNFKWQYIYVVVNFLSQVIFVFLLFWGMVMYANEVATKEK